MPRLADAVIPLYRRASDGLPEHYGSGTLLTFGGVGFLATAAHCLDTLVDQGVFVPAREQVVGVEATGRRCDDPFDLGFLRLANELAHALAERAYFLAPHNIDADDSFRPEAHYTFVGFPWRQSKRLFGPKRFLQQTITLTGKSLNPETMLADKLDSNIHIAIEFDREKVKAPDGTLQTAPMPQGMSGGAVFNVRRRPNPERPAELRLAGLGTFEGARRLQGVRIAALLHLIRELNPDVAASVPISRRYVFGESTAVCDERSEP